MGYTNQERPAFEVPGSPVNALNTDPPFREYHFIDLNPAKAEHLSSLAQGSGNVYVHDGDCNEILLALLDKMRWEDYRRGLCLLDPYNIDVAWDVVAKAGKLRSGRDLPQLHGDGHEHERTAQPSRKGVARSNPTYEPVLG